MHGYFAALNQNRRGQQPPGSRPPEPSNRTTRQKKATARGITPERSESMDKENRPRKTPGGNNYLTNKQGSLKSNQVISIIKDKRGRESR